MKLKKSLWAAAGAVLLATGVAVAQEKTETKPGGEPKPATPRAARPAMDRTAALANYLKLSDEQKTKIKPILDEEQSQQQALMQDKTIGPEAKIAKRKEIRDATTAKVTPLLTEGEQLQKWEKMRNPQRNPGRPGAPGGPAAPGSGAAPKPAAPPAPAK